MIVAGFDEDLPRHSRHVKVSNEQQKKINTGRQVLKKKNIYIFSYKGGSEHLVEK